MQDAHTVTVGCSRLFYPQSLLFLLTARGSAYAEACLFYIAVVCRALPIGMLCTPVVCSSIIRVLVFNVAFVV